MIRRAVYTACLALGLCFAMVWLRNALGRRESGPPEAPPAAVQTAAPPPVSSAPARVRVLNGGEVAEMALQDYLVGVVAAEMPASFEPEALKAQAVAARSYTLYCARTGRRAEADVCTDYACCQAWRSEADMRDRWGEAFAENRARIQHAVDETAGQYLAYEGQAVFAAFHSSSAGYTEDCGAIWSGLPYLVSVPSPENADSVPNYVSRVEVTPLDFRDTLLFENPEADFTSAPEAWIGELTRDGSGRVSGAVLGGADFTGVKLRSLFSLRSTAFTLEYADGVFVFTVTGFGHGVGMSQYGANVMAAEGADYRAILAHYYPGTELTG